MSSSLNLNDSRVWNANLYEGGKARAPARAKRGECDTVVYTRVFEEIVYVAWEYTSDQKTSVLQASVHRMLQFIVYRI